MTKKIMAAIVVMMAVCLSSCEMFNVEPKTTYSNPFPEELEFGSYYCTGNSGTGEVSIGIAVKSIGNVSSVYFGYLTAYGDGATYTNGVQAGYIGNVSTPNGVEVWAEYNGQFTTLKNVDTSLKNFEKIVIPITVNNSIKDLEFENMPITWN